MSGQKFAAVPSGRVASRSTMVSRYWDRIGSSSSDPSVVACQSAKWIVPRPVAAPTAAGTNAAARERSHSNATLRSHPA